MFLIGVNFIISKYKVNGNKNESARVELEG